MRCHSWCVGRIMGDYRKRLGTEFDRFGRSRVLVEAHGIHTKADHCCNAYGILHVLFQRLSAGNLRLVDF